MHDEEQVLFRCYSLFDTDEDGKLTLHDVRTILHIMGMDSISAELIFMQYDTQIRTKGGFTFAVFKELVKDLAAKFRGQDGGKYYALLSLEEAEHFRGVLHARQHVNLLPHENEQGHGHGQEEKGGGLHTTAALWFMSDLDMTVLATSRGYACTSFPIPIITFLFFVCVCVVPCQLRLGE